jgi:uncharacterized protein (DUF2164 family)
MPITLKKDIEQQLIDSIKLYFTEHMSDEIGDLRAALLLEFCLKEIGPSIYNQAIADARRYMEEKAADFETICYEPEFGYWQ